MRLPYSVLALRLAQYNSMSGTENASVVAEATTFATYWKVEADKQNAVIL